VPTINSQGFLTCHTFKPLSMCPYRTIHFRELQVMAVTSD
jgi:hypothetical protein